MNGSLFSKAGYMNGSLFSITRFMNGVCFKVSGGTSVPKLPSSYPLQVMQSSQVLESYVNNTWSFTALSTC